ncbi:MAG: hypothetical protein WC231_05635 [Dehalococcoidales bacterium]|jgi:hypothetical protein|nr:hypothetical protein [Dehalococcoidales bacterium]MDX9986243.1 hypothetical protein [Dehalococcoidales bacterium]NLE90521.1 hypothetical protein [Dehalococcoidales bacterium]
MAILCLLFNLLGLATSVTGILTVLDIFPAFIAVDPVYSPALETAIFWWAISVILILSGIAFGVYQSSENRFGRDDRELPSQP